MELYEAMVRRMAESAAANALHSLDLPPMVDNLCYHTLRRIEAVLADDSLDDPACFHKIDEIVQAFYAIGSHAGGRHDFG